MVDEYTDILTDEIGLDCDKKYLVYLALRQIVFGEEYDEEDIEDMQEGDI